MNALPWAFKGGGDRNQFDWGAMLERAVGLISGLCCAENTFIAQIPQSSVYVLSLEAHIQPSAR
ncbi:MAG: hypothetical protein V7K21_08770 [Nostoc sp.]|uniref:hypothetical protein n=1 Tax=Nostoc sp. TaxID=1180 RepID=UPI002FF576A5